MRLAILGHGSVAKALLPLLARDSRFEVAYIHSRSQPATPVEADVLVELTTLNPTTGEPAISHIRAAFARNMHVVTANKGPIAHAYYELAAEAATRNLKFRFESAVMDGAPVFNQFRNNMPGVTVLGFAGVLNSTSKLVIEAMEQGGTFEDGLATARAMGVAEADATHDIDGHDSACKTAALANVLMDARTTPQAVATTGIAHFTPDHVRKIAAEGKTIRLVSRARRDQLSASCEILDRTDILASAQGTSNIILFETDHMGTFGTVSISPGVTQTAYGVYIDLISLLG